MGLARHRAFPHVQPRPDEAPLIGGQQRLRRIEIVAVIQLDKRPAREVPLVVELAHSITGLVLVEPIGNRRLACLEESTAAIASIQAETGPGIPI